ncbi:Xanthine phosphoribosyltransferase [Xylophilus ampelinus]|nr:phosphoribosyltransferase [Variovorax sp.]VTY24834.1 Xanthine phosphoribosyltransferase [Xylophilus ampelinus]
MTTSSPTPPAPFTEPTTAYWQRIVDADEAGSADGPWQYGYPARLPDGRVLVLPIRALDSEPTHAVASLICNQASLEVVETLGRMLAERLAPLAPEVVIGIPTLGLTFAPVVARHLGHSRYVPMGYSRKFWYDEALSGAVQSITTPTAGKRVYLDPNLLPLVQGKRVVLVDDAVSSGSTLGAPWTLIESLGAQVLACGVAMRQGRRWVQTLGPERAARLVGVFDSPLLQAVDGGWGLRD